MIDIFNLDLTETERIKMSSAEFVDKTQTMLNEILTEYGKSWYNRELEDSETEIAPCGKCKGNGCFNLGEKEINCVVDRENGSCYERCFDAQNFIEFMENEILFGDKPFLELSQCEVIHSLTQKELTVQL